MVEWEDFNKDNDYSENLVYWYDEWDRLCFSVEKGGIGIDIISARIILSDIVNEFELNQFQSENNRKVYIKLIQKVTIPDKYKSSLFLLKEALETRDVECAYIIAKDTLMVMSKESLAIEWFEKLRKVLKNQKTDKLEREKIRKLSKSIIIDLVTSGKRIEAVKKYLSNVFHIPVGDSLSGQLESEEVKCDVLSIHSRLDLIKEMMLFKEEAFVFVFPIWGSTIIPGETYANWENGLLGCYLYHPEIMKEFPELDDEFMNESFNNSFHDERGDANKEVSTKKKSQCNAKIVVSDVSEQAAYRKAETRLFRLINILNVNYSSQHREVFWDRCYIGKNLTTGEVFSSFSGWDHKTQIRERISRSNPLELSKNHLSTVNQYANVMEVLERKKMVFEQSAIDRAVALLSKSRYISDEDRLVNYWTVLETLTGLAKRANESMYELIQRVLSNIYFLYGKYVPLRRLFSLTGSYQMRMFRKDDTVFIPEKFSKETGLNQIYAEGVSISLKPFYERMRELLKYTTKLSYLDEIHDTIAFYEDNSTALGVMQKEREEARLTISYIYKCRNQIVHNGYVDQNLIPYLVNYAEGYARSLLSTIIGAYEKEKTNLREHFMWEVYQSKLLERKLHDKCIHLELMDF